MNSPVPSQEQIQEWRDNPVTEALRLALEGMIEARKRAITESYWAGKPVDDADRRAVVLVGEFCEDLFSTDEDDLRVAMEKIDEWKRHKADGIQRLGEAQGG